MKLSKLNWRAYSLSLAATALVSLTGCVPIDRTPRPTLDAVRSGSARGQIADDTRLRPGEVPGEIAEVNRPRQEIYVLTDDGRKQVVRYDVNRTRVTFHGWDYSVDNLEAGDRIAYHPEGNRYVDFIRIEEPVQARPGPRAAVPPPSNRPRTDVVEGTVERVDPSLGVFDIRPSPGRTVTVSVPYNARSADVDSFRALRRGDPVRIEGQFISPENFQLLSFLSPRDR
jgi:hypothetical protein